MPCLYMRDARNCAQGRCTARNMAQKPSFGLPVVAILLATLSAAGVQAQGNSVSRLAGDWSSTPLVALSASRPPMSVSGLPVSGIDQGAAPAGENLTRMLLLLTPSPAQQQALAAEIANLQNPSSPQYHQWLTPAEFASSYANSASDVSAVVAWLGSQGFQVAPLPAGRGWIEFSGTVAQAEQAFQVQIDMVAGANGIARPVVMGNISVPGALQPLIAGLVSLDGVASRPAVTTPQPLAMTVAELTAETSLAGAEALTPELAAQLLDLQPLATANITGAGQTIAIASRSNVNTADVAAFRSAFGLPASPLTVSLDGADPGLTDGQAEATLAASWAGAAAPGAQIVLVPAATTSATDGVDLSLSAIVDQDLASTVVAGYSACEAGMSPAHQEFYSALYQQAAAEGMAVIAAAGDNGAAACAVSGAPVSTGYGVNALASTPWDTAVGVAGFGPSGPSGGLTAGLAAWSPSSAADPAYAGGGGASTLYPLPGWQPLPAQLPSAITRTSRLLPDLSLPTAIDNAANPGLAFCFTAGTPADGSASGSSAGCTLMRSGGSGAAASYFAGIAALIAEQHGSEGNLAPGLYQLSNQNAVFNDVQQGSTQLQCAAGSSGCNADGQIGFSAAPGYDLATGLGVPHAASLVSEFASPQVTGTNPATVGLSISPVQSSYNPAASITLTANVPGSAGVTPTGSVTFYDSSSGNDIAQPQTLVNGSVSINVSGGFTSGTNEMVAEYSGDDNYAPANSTPSDINIQPSTTSLAITQYPSSVTPGQTISVVVTLTVGTPPAGTVPPSGVVTLNVDNGTGTYTASLSASGTATFSSVVIPANTATTHTLQATYPANTDYQSSTSSTVTVTVAAVTPTVTVTPATTSPQPGSSLQVSIAVAPPQSGETPPTGTVSLTLDGNSVGSATLSPQAPASLATISITTPANGTHTLVATYTPDANSTPFYNPATSGPASFTVALVPTTTVDNASSTTPALGSSLTVSTTITPKTYSSSDPTGTVTYTLDGTTEGTQTVTPGAPSTSTITFTVPDAGTHTLEGVYSGDGNYATSTAAPITITVAKLNTTTTVTPGTTTPSAGSSLSATATVSSTGTSTIAPTGTVTFTIDGATVATEGLSGTLPATVSATFTVPSAGTHTLQASYSGDTNYAASTSSGATLTVSKTTPTVALSPATTTPAAGSSLQLTAQINTPAAGATAPTGTVNFSLDGSPVGTALVNGGTATLTITTPAVGTHSLVATYGGDSNYNAATSPTVTIDVTKGNTTLAVSPSTTTPTANSTMLVTATLTATVTGSTIPTGTVSFTMDGATVGSGTLSGGTTASTTITVPTTGTHTLQASYSGDSNFNGAISPTVVFTVAKTNTTTVVVPSTTTPALGATLPVTASVSANGTAPAAPTGNITFTVDGVTEGIQALTPGTPSTASITLPALSPGTHTIAAIYSGDQYYATSTSAGATVTVPKDPTTTTVSAATTTPAGGSSLAVSATIVASTPGTQLPTGSVNFLLDGTTVATSAIVPGTPSTATGTIPSITPGTHVLQAVYTGDTYYGTSTSQSVTLTVSKSPTTITISPSTLTPTAGGSMVVTANISSSNPSTVAPTGTVTITMDGVAVATGTVVPGTPSVANVTVPLVSAGTHVLAGSYSGDSFYTPSNSSTVTINASKGATVTTVTATPPSLTAGTPEALTASIAPANAVAGTTYTITGVVDFYDGTKLLGQVAVVNNSATITGVTLANNVDHSITAVYSGDTNWLGSSSAVLPLEATTLPDTVVLTSNYNVAQPGAAVVLTATVTPNSTPTAGVEPNPTGTVVFYQGTTVIGTAGLIPTAPGDSSTATLTVQTLPGGVDQLTAVYQGDLTYDQAASNVLSLTIEAFSIAPCSSNPPTNLNIVQGGAGAECFTVTGEGGFNNEIQLICTPPAADNMTCTASPQQITPPGSVTFVVGTSTTPLASASPVDRGPRWPRDVGGAALAGLLFFLLPFGRRARTLLRAGSTRALILILLLAGLAGAGIGCTSNNTTLARYGTPLGVATLKVTGTAYVDNTVVSQSVYFTVNVVAP